MQTIKSLAAAAALTLLGSASAFADDAFYLTMDSGAKGQFTNTWTFGNGVFNGGPAGSVFDDFYAFNLPDTERVSFSVTSDPTDSGVGSTSFDGGQYGWALYSSADGSLIDMQYATDPYALLGELGLMTSGTYVLEVEGEYAVDYGTYSGLISGTPQIAAVPEPSSWMLLLTGALALAGIGRRRIAPRRSGLAGG